MKTELPKKSLIIKSRLDEIVKEILAISKGKIAMIILFGSYARGSAVRDYVNGYESDLDIMVLTKSSQNTGYRKSLLEFKMEERLERKGLRDKPWVTFVVEPIERVNKELEKKQYFFSDIKKEGIMLYDSGEFQLAEPRDLNWEEQKEVAKDYFEDWFPYGSGLLIDTGNALNRGDFKISAFLLHQVTESFYNAILLVFTGYKPRTHDIKKLGSLASNYSNELLKIFPRDTKELKDRFILLQEAYIKARYDRTYKITEEELRYLIERVEKLKAVTEEICQNWINQ